MNEKKFIANRHYGYHVHWLKKRKRVRAVTRKLSENKEWYI